MHNVRNVVLLKMYVNWFHNFWFRIFDWSDKYLCYATTIYLTIRVVTIWQSISLNTRLFKGLTWKTKQNKTKQSKTKQNKNKTKTKTNTSYAFISHVNWAFKAFQKETKKKKKKKKSPTTQILYLVFEVYHCWYYMQLCTQIHRTFFIQNSFFFLLENIGALITILDMN